MALTPEERQKLFEARKTWTADGQPVAVEGKGPSRPRPAPGGKNTHAQYPAPQMDIYAVSPGGSYPGGAYPGGAYPGGAYPAPPAKSSGTNTGLIVGIVVLAVVVMIGVGGIVAAIAIPNLLKSRQAANEASAIGAVRAIARAQASHSSKAPKGAFAELSTLVAEGYLDRRLAAGQFGGYRFVSMPVNLPGRAAMFDTIAVPLTVGSFGTGNRSFGSNETYVIYMADGSVEIKGTLSNRVPSTGRAIQ